MLKPRSHICTASDADQSGPSPQYISDMISLLCRPFFSTVFSYTINELLNKTLKTTRKQLSANDKIATQ